MTIPLPRIPAGILHWRGVSSSPHSPFPNVALVFQARLLRPGCFYGASLLGLRRVPHVPTLHVGILLRASRVGPHFTADNCLPPYWNDFAPKG